MEVEQLRKEVKLERQPVSGRRERLPGRRGGRQSRGRSREKPVTPRAGYRGLYGTRGGKKEHVGQAAGPGAAAQARSRSVPSRRGDPGGGRGNGAWGASSQDSPGTGGLCNDASSQPLWGQDRGRCWRHTTSSAVPQRQSFMGVAVGREERGAPFPGQGARGADMGPPAAAAPVAFGTFGFPSLASPWSPVPAQSRLP